ncbi:hypothetical protein B0H16DRAFT_1457345 [Mycena metata]|uniref:FAS1 domain-containing protein n=1 Tax=Mycena metata TaxID=1033252 RepID=A0AAD7JAP5_9AGAR|nr:hypothetical protein B0H16DRAFT_1457345 [Mycena metata]
MHTLLPWMLSTTLVGGTLGLFQPQALTGDKAYELMRSGGEYTISKLNALNAVLNEIGDNSTLIDLLSPVPYEERFGQLALENIEAYNASASNVIASFVHKKPYIQKCLLIHFVRDSFLWPDESVRRDSRAHGSWKQIYAER